VPAHHPHAPSGAVVVRLGCPRSLLKPPPLERTLVSHLMVARCPNAAGECFHREAVARGDAPEAPASNDEHSSERWHPRLLAKRASRT